MSGLPDEIRRRAPSLAEGRYLVVEAIESDLLVQTYRVYDTRIQLFRVVQVLSPTFAQDTSVRQAFVEQSTALVSFHHGNVVRLVDVHPRAALPWVVTDDHHGLTVEDQLGINGPLAPRRAVRVLRQGLAGLQALHDAGFVHSDIQPSRFYLGPDGAATLAPPSVRWGIGAALLEFAIHGYIAPEQRRDPELRSVAADLYGVGATIVSMFTADDPPDFLFELDDDDPALAAVPEAFRSIVAACCRFRPAERPASARLVVEQLVRAAQVAGPDAATALLLQPPATLALPVGPTFPALQAILDPAPELADREPRDPVELEVPWSRAQAFDEPDDDSSNSITERVATPLPYRIEGARRREIDDWTPGRPRVNPDSLPMYVDRDAVLRQVEEEEADVVRREVVTPEGVARTEPPPAAAATPGPSSSAPAPIGARSQAPARSRSASARPRPVRRERREPSLLRWVVLGSVAGVGLATIAFVLFGLAVAAAGLQLGNARGAVEASRAQLYQTILDHEPEIASLGGEAYDAHREWVTEKEEPARLEGALAFLDRFAAEVRQVPSTDPRRVGLADTARRFATSRETHRRSLDVWLERSRSLTARTALALGGARPPPEL